jgi:hypothetical protein
MLVPLREEIQLLSAAEILEPLSEEEVEDLARQNPDVRIQEGEILFTPDEVGESLYIVKEGRIRLYITSPKGEEATLARMRKLYPTDLSEEEWGSTSSLTCPLPTGMGNRGFTAYEDAGFGTSCFPRTLTAY